jgi:hypothetical protein
MNFAINPLKGVWHSYRSNVGGDTIAWIAYAHCGVPETECNDLSVKQFMDVKNWLRNNGYEKQLSMLATEYFESKEDPGVASVDTSKLLAKLFQKKSPLPALKKDNGPTEEEDIEEEIKNAQSRNLLPPFPELDPGIFRDYLEFGKKVSYSLEEYHFASLLSIASMAIGRKVRIQIGMISIYTNIFSMVVGQTTISGKSAACNMAVNSFEKSIVHEEPLAKFNSTNILRGTMSEPALIQSLNEIYNSFWYYDDCSGFFTDIPAWNQHILSTMCTIYDGTPIERTLSKSKRSKNEDQYKWSCPYPFVSILFNMTTKDVEDVASSRLFSSGFFPRIMWFWGQGGHPRMNEDIDLESQQQLAHIDQRIKNVRNILSGLPNDSIIFGICKAIEEWKMDITVNRLEKEDEAYRTAVSRGFILAYKIAAILTIFDPAFQAIAFGREKYPIKATIPEQHAKMAIRIVEQYLVPRMMTVYSLCNASDAKNHRNIVMTSLSNLGGHAERSKLLRQSRLDSKELNAALITLEESNEIKICKMTKPGNCKPTRIIIKL